MFLVGSKKILSVKMRIYFLGDISCWINADRPIVRSCTHVAKAISYTLCKSGELKIRSSPEVLIIGLASICFRHI